MNKNCTLQLLPHEAASEEIIRYKAAQHFGINEASVTHLSINKRSIDARGKQPQVLLALSVTIDEPYLHKPLSPLTLKDVSSASKKAVIAGAGPAGLFAALRLIELGIQPVILERGKDVRSRRRDLALLNKEGILNPESNYCFGEGGAGTYSDGKLYTRSNKRGNVQRILEILVQFGAAENILYDAHPHIGTNKLPHIITAMREQVIACGGIVEFNCRVTGFTIVNDTVKEVTTAASGSFSAGAVLLATGHSARDIFGLLQAKGILIESKPFAIGVRAEHPQELIDKIQYHQPQRDPFLPPASYSLVQQVGEKGVFSFCMCPGGIIAPASTGADELVVNGWSPSKRNNPFANSGIVVAVEEEDMAAYIREYGALGGMKLQQETERKCYAAGGGKFVAPAQRMEDFTKNRISSTLPACSYVPGIHSAALTDILPPFIVRPLQKAFTAFGKKMKGYFTNDAVLVATESRTSSPVRIPRTKDTLMHPQVKGLFPCGEGAGYAGGIVSAAMDGERAAAAIAAYLSINQPKKHGNNYTY